MCVEIAYLIDHEVVFSKLDEKMFSDTVSGGQDPPWCNEGTTAKYLTVLVQNGNLPWPAAFGSLFAPCKTSNKQNYKSERFKT